METNIEKNKFKFAFSTFGGVSGIVYSIYKKTGFWKGVGYYFLFSLIGIGLGSGIDYLIKPSKEEEND